MDRKQFMEKLSDLLRDLPEKDRQEALEYYNGYFDDAGPDQEWKLIQELGSPEKVAESIKAGFAGDGDPPAVKDPPRKAAGKKRGNTVRAVVILAVIVLVFAYPLLKGGLGMVLGGALLVVLFPLVLVLTLVLAGLNLAGRGISTLFRGIGACLANPFGGIVQVGMGCFYTAVGVLLFILALFVAVKVLPRWFGSLVGFFRRIFKGKEKDRN